MLSRGLTSPRIPFNTGFTLLEVLITVVVLSIAATSIMGVYVNSVRTSADPMIQQQAVSIAEAYMEEILLKQFCHNPDPNPLVHCTLETSGAEAGEVRSTYNDIRDYNDLGTTSVQDQNGNAVAGLTAYSVTVVVGGRALAGGSTIPSSAAMRIDVTVSHPAIDPITISGFRTDY